MKRILFIVHGLLRPDLESVINNKNLLLSNFDECEKTTLLSTWFNNKELDQDNREYEVNKSVIEENFNLNLISSQPDIDMLLSQIKTFDIADMSKPWWISNLYGVFHFYTKMIQIAKTYTDFDYYVFCRTDLKIMFDKFNFETSDFHFPVCFWYEYGRTQRHNDHFFICNKNSFLKSFQNLDLTKINELIKTSRDPETLFQNVINESKYSFIPSQKVKNYYIVRNYRNWSKNDVDELGRDSIQSSIDYCLGYISK